MGSFPSGRSRYGCLDDVHQLPRRFDFLILSGFDDEFRDSARPSFLAVVFDDIRKLLPAVTVHHIACCEGVALVHPHIQRRVLHVGKSSLAVVQLKGGNADVQDRSIDARNAVFRKHVLDFRVSALHQDLPALQRRESLACRLQRVPVSVDSDEQAFLRKLLPDPERVTAASQRPVRIDPIRFDIQMFHAFLKQDRHMLEFHGHFSVRSRTSPTRRRFHWR